MVALTTRGTLLPSPLRGGRQAAYGGRLLEKDAEAKASAMGGGYLRRRLTLTPTPPPPSPARGEGAQRASGCNDGSELLLQVLLLPPADRQRAISVACDHAGRDPRQ